MIPSKKTEPFSIAKAEPLGPAGVVGSVQRIRSTQLGTRIFFAWSERNVAMWREVVNTGRSWVRERVRRRQRLSVGPPPNWSAQTRVLSATGCPLAQTKLGKRAAGATGSGPGAVVSLRPTIRPLGTSSKARSRAQGWAGIRSRAIAAIGSNSLASLPDRMPAGDFTRWGHGLFER